MLVKYFTTLPMKMELIEGSETSAYINQTPGNYPKGNLLYSVHGESLKSRIFGQFVFCEVHIIGSIGMRLWPGFGTEVWVNITVGQNVLTR